MVNVICMKWGDKFDASYVNILAAMVRRNLGIQHRFACFTEKPQGIDSRVEIFPLPELTLPSGIPERGWRKLCTFASELGDLQGQTLFLDLDVVIVDRLDCFFELEGEFLIGHDWHMHRKRKIIGNSSCYRFEIGKHPDVLETFRQNSDAIRAKHRNEQAFLSHHMYKKGILKFWPETWCPSFKSQCWPRFPMRYFVAPKKPVDAKLVVFHGDPNPPEAAVARYDNWRKYWHPSEWIMDYWNDSDEVPTASKAA